MGSNLNYKANELYTVSRAKSEQVVTQLIYVHTQKAKIAPSIIMSFKLLLGVIVFIFPGYQSNRKAMNRNWSNQKANPPS